MDAIGEYEDYHQEHRAFPSFLLDTYADEPEDNYVNPLSDLPDLRMAFGQRKPMEIDEEEQWRKDDDVHIDPIRMDKNDPLRGTKESCIGLQILHGALFPTNPENLGQSIQGVLETPKELTNDELGNATPSNGAKLLGLPLKLVSSTVDDSYSPGLAAFSMASFGGPVGAIIRCLPQNVAVTLVGERGRGILLVDPHSDPRLVKRDAEAKSRGQFRMAPLGGHPGVCEGGHNAVSVAEYFSQHYAFENDQFETSIYVPAPVVADKGKEEASDGDTRSGSKSPSNSVHMENLSLGVQFEPEEMEDGKRKRIQPAPGSPMRIESEESEEKKVRAPPATTTSIPTTPAAVETKPRRKSTTPSTMVASKPVATPIPTVAPAKAKSAPSSAPPVQKME